MDKADANYPRSFVPADADMGDWDRIAPLFDALDARPIDTPEQLERWILDGSELAACISQEQTRRHVAMTCQTDDPVREQAFLYFVENIMPRCKPRWHALRVRYINSPARDKLPRDRYAVYDRSIAAAVEIFRDENVPLQTEEDKLDQQYQKLCGAMTVKFDGREQTLQQMGRYLQEPDPVTRRRAWELVGRRRLIDRDPIDDIFDKLVEIRDRIGRNANLDNFRDYQFKVYERFDYTPDDCFAFHGAVERVAVPLLRRIQDRRRRTMGLDVLRPWDLSVDPLGRPPLRPFQTADQLCLKCREIFARIDPELGNQFEQMVQAGWLDLDSRKGKAPGGYQATYDETRHPFIFMNAVGLHRDVETLLHEGGHAFHSLACRGDPLVNYRHTTMEMAEVASMGMELLAGEHLDVFYRGDELARARRELLEGVVSLFPWVATIDAFQHWIYTNPGHSRLDRTACWRELLARFGGIEDWSGYQDIRDASWQRQLHLFGVPFYYIEYGIAQLGALQLWRNFRADPAGALAAYLAALALGGSQPLPKLWQTAGLKFDFSEKTLAPLLDMVSTALEHLED